MTKRFDIAKGSRWPILSGYAELDGGTLALADGTPLETAHVSAVEVRVWLEGADEGDYIVDEDATDYSVSDGKINFEYAWSEDDAAALPASAHLRGQIKITLSDGRIGYAPTDADKWLRITVHGTHGEPE